MSDGMTDRRSEPECNLEARRTAEQPIPKFTDHLTYLDEVARDDVRALEIAERNYGSSWKKRGGVGAFMMLSRKWDRIENALRPMDDDETRANLKAHQIAPWDIFGAIAADTRPEGIIDDIRDLRRYLILVESEMRARGAASAQSR